jgi:hypothetical protein
MKRTPTILCGVLFLTLAAACGLQAAEFAATGPARETKLEPGKFLGAVKVTFALLPTTMSFDLPWHFCAVSENGLKFAHFAAETYDPREWDGTGADASFEPGMDQEGRYARVWIEHQSVARIVVRVRYALNNSKYEIAHDDLKTDSPYNDGKGDWGEEWFDIYPDGTYLRHMKIHTALAAMSQPFGLFREPPNGVHEFMELVVIGPRDHVPTDDILKLAWSWISPPELQMPDAKKSPNDSTGRYNVFTYDQTQKAYIVPRKTVGPEHITFALDATLRAERAKAAEQRTRAAEAARLAAEQKAAHQRELLASAPHPAFGPGIRHVAAVAADILALTIQEKEFVPVLQAAYEPQAGDKTVRRGKEAEKVLVVEDGRVQESLIEVEAMRQEGKRQVKLGDLAVNAKRLKPEDKAIGADRTT